MMGTLCANTLLIVAIVALEAVLGFPGELLGREKRVAIRDDDTPEGNSTTFDKPYLIDGGIALVKGSSTSSDDVKTRYRDFSDSSDGFRTRHRDSSVISDDVITRDRGSSDSSDGGKTRDRGSSASSDDGKTRDRGSSASNDLSDDSEGSGSIESESEESERSIESESEESERRKCARTVVTATTVGVATIIPSMQEETMISPPFPK